MEMGTERSKPLHNFMMPPSLKWGNQRFLRCVKVNPYGKVSAAAATDRRSSASEVEMALIRRRRDSDRTEMKERLKKSLESASGWKTPGPDPKRKAKGGGDDGIEAVREKLMFDLQTAADKMKFAILGEGGLMVPPAAAAALAPGDAESLRPWNLRTRRAACKAPNGLNDVIGGNGGGGGGSPVGGGGSKNSKIDERKLDYSPLRTENRSPRLRGNVTARAAMDGLTGKKRERAKFSVSLSRQEIEQDFMVMAGRRPHRRPKKRPKIVQKQLDSLFPGLWLTEVTTDIYEVADDAP